MVAESPRRTPPLAGVFWYYFLAAAPATLVVGTLMDDGRSPAACPQARLGSACMVKCSSPPAMISPWRRKTRSSGLPLRVTAPTYGGASSSGSAVTVNDLPP